MHPEPELEDFSPEDLEPRAFVPPSRRRMLWIGGILLTLLLLLILPPLVHVNRYQRQIAASISQSLGRPVHTGAITLNLLPWPGFTIENFVVNEDPAFGSEPVIRANSVQARLRWRSLFLRRVEFSRITLTDPSVNLVRLPDGRWNLESILLQASRMPAAPTAQRGPGDRPRFPYIEATGARLNIKMGTEKMPLALTDADLALWLPQAGQWHLQLVAHPSRTDTAASDTGVVRLEGTLGRASRLEDVPVDLQASWTSAPLGAASWVLMGRDAGMRGDLTLTAAVQGTVGRNAAQARLHLAQLRRADFVPAQTLDVDLDCTATATSLFRHLTGVRCAWPPSSGTLVVTGDVPDTLAPATADLHFTLKDLPAASLLDVLRAASKRVSPDLTLTGTLSGQASCCRAALETNATFAIDHAQLALGKATPYVSSQLTGASADSRIQLQPIPLDLGALTPATLEASFNRAGYTLHLTGLADSRRLLELCAALPQFGDGLPELLPEATATPIHLDYVSTRAWTQPPTWTPAPLTRPTPPHKHTRH